MSALMAARRLSSLALLRSDPRVEFVDDERGIGNGIIVTLREGLFFYDDCGVKGFDTVREAVTETRAAIALASKGA